MTFDGWSSSPDPADAASPLTVSLFGLGYVGCVTAACLAHKGHRVIGVDVNPDKVNQLEAGRSPILEPGLEELVDHAHRACRLHATTDAAAAVRDSEISLICVGTPSLRNGKLDLRALERACAEVGAALARKDGFHTVVLRSTVLPGTTESLLIPALEAAAGGRRAGADFTACVNPEFLREGSAVADFFHPTLTVFGAADPRELAPLRRLYRWAPGRVFETSVAAAEMLKYVSNAFHGLKVSFANEVGTLCKQLGVDAQAVMEIFTADTRLNISPAYLSPGFAFGGSCLPKDLRALTYRAKELDVHVPLLDAILPSNQEHIERAVEAVLRTNKRKVGLLGLSFKAGTDDLRESPLVHLAKRLLGEGLELQIWDPQVSLGRLLGSNRQFIEDTIPHLGRLLCPSLAEVVGNAEVVLLGASAADAGTLRPLLRPGHVVIDLVNLDKARRPQDCPNYEGICW